jgi:serine/threonine protein kinase
MALSVGSHVGPYEIVSAIGKGGMGEVNCAKDTRLHRDAAIKISAEKFSERFAREAHGTSQGFEAGTPWRRSPGHRPY